MITSMTVDTGLGPQRALKLKVLLAPGTMAMLAAVTAACPVHAQSTSPAEHESELVEVVVTGSRLPVSGFETPTPVTVLNAEDISREAPQNIADYLNKLPVFGASPAPGSTSGSVSDASGGMNNLNLRALGANRTLVLLDGVRVVPSSVTGFYQNGGSVDINQFPDALIKRVDVVTGGASAAYGSDALAGVVNFILDKEFTGVKGTLQGGGTTYGDDGQFRASIAAGTGFDDGRGHLLVSGSADGNDGILVAGSSRSWMADSYCRIKNPAYTSTNGQPFFLIRPNCGSSVTTPGGLISGGPLRGVDFGPGGVPRAFNYGAPNDGFQMSGGDWQVAPGAIGALLGSDASLDSKVNRHNLFTRLSYDITDDFTVYGQFDFAKTRSEANCCVGTGSFTIQSGNPFIPAFLQAQMDAQDITSFPLRTYNTQLGRTGSSNTREFYQYLAGANGKFSLFETQWHWDAYIQRTQSDIDANTVNNTLKSRFALATDVVRSPVTGAPICRSTLTNPGNGCVPYNPMGIGVNSLAALNYVKGDDHLDQFLRQDAGSVGVRGEPFATWAGPLSVALGVEYRRESAWGGATPNPLNDFYLANYRATEGAYHVSEGYIETLVPLARNTSWADSLDLNLAARETHYSTSGSVTTWKLGITYAPFSDLRFRATQSRDIRSPNMGEYFSAGIAGVVTVVDPFNGNVTVPVTRTQIGNPDLEPEEADTTGAGIIYQPSWLPGLSASLDYYYIEIKQAITSLPQQPTVGACFAGNQVFCDLINRDASGNITNINSTPTNTAFAKTRGVDIEVSYAKQLSEMWSTLNGEASARLLVTHVDDLTIVSPDNRVLQGAGVHGGTLGGLTVPRWQYSLTLGYNQGSFGASVTGRGFGDGIQNSQWIECSSACPASTAPYYTIDNNRMPGKFYLDLSLNYEFANLGPLSGNLFAAVDNVMNENPTDIALLGYSPGPYDLFGRVYRAGIRFKL